MDESLVAALKIGSHAAVVAYLLLGYRGIRDIRAAARFRLTTERLRFFSWGDWNPANYRQPGRKQIEEGRHDLLAANCCAAMAVTLTILADTLHKGSDILPPHLAHLTRSYLLAAGLVSIIGLLMFLTWSWRLNPRFRWGALACGSPVYVALATVSLVLFAKTFP